MSIPKAFISYSYDDSVHQDWVLRLATRLRTDGIDVTLDLWHLAFGDQLPLFMERAVRENQFVLIACTPRYKERSDNRQGGVGYEGDIMTADALAFGDLCTCAQPRAIDRSGEEGARSRPDSKSISVIRNQYRSER